jgi:hypothetical protein
MNTLVLLLNYLALQQTLKKHICIVSITNLFLLLFFFRLCGMCIYLTGSQDLGKTKIFVSPVVLDNGRLAQFTLYQNDYYNEGDNETEPDPDQQQKHRVMILPIPYYTGKHSKYNPFHEVSSKTPKDREQIILMPDRNANVHYKAFDDLHKIIEKHGNDKFLEARQEDEERQESGDKTWARMRQHLLGIDEIARGDLNMVGIGLDDDDGTSGGKARVFTSPNGDYEYSIATTAEDLSPERLQTNVLGLDNEEMTRCMDFLRSKYGNDAALKKEEEKKTKDGEDIDDDDDSLDDVGSMDIGTIYGRKVTWAFLVCKVREGVTQPHPLMYIHALYSIDDMGFEQDDENYLQQALFIPTIHYHEEQKKQLVIQSSSSTKKHAEELSKFNHSIIALYPNVFSGAGVGISKSMKQRQLQRCTTRLKGTTNSISFVGDKVPHDVFDASPYDLLAVANKLIQTFPSITWPFQHPDIGCVSYLDVRSILLYEIDQELPNRDIYLPVQSNLLAFFGP